MNEFTGKAADRARFEAGRIAKEIKKRREVPNVKLTSRPAVGRSG